MAYLNKQSFKELLQLWRKVLKDKDYSLLEKDDEWLMKAFIPARFICDIRFELANSWVRKEKK